MSLPYEMEMSSVKWQDKEPVPKKNKEENADGSKADGDNDENRDESGAGPSDDEAAVENRDRDDLAAAEQKDQKTPAPPPKSKRDTSSRRSQRSHRRAAMRSRDKSSSTPRRRPESQRSERKLKPYNERREAVTARRTNAEKEKHEQEEAEEQAKEEKVVDSDDDETKKKKAAPEKAKNNIPLRKPPTVSTRATGDGSEEQESQQRVRDETEEDAEHADGEGEKKKFPTRLWSKKRDYAGEHERKQADANEKRREEFEKNGSPRIKQPKKEKEQGKIFFNQVHKAKDVWNQRLPDIIDFRYLPKRPEEKIEEVTERLSKKNEPKAGKPPPPPETLDDEGIETLNDRLYKQKRRYDEEALERPKHKVIEPTVLEEEDIDRIVTKLYDTKSEAAERKREKMAWHSNASKVPRLDPEGQKAIVSRLHDPNHVARRDEKTLSKLGGIQGDGWSPERHHISYRQEFEKKHNFSQ